MAQSKRVQMDLVNSYPELRVDGQPFFIHSAAFFYSRLPRDQWETALKVYRDLGINTIDLYIQWNWHEPSEGQLDFDGHSNPRRDLQGLLTLISKLGFNLIIRPGPVILNEWKNGGYPDWLLLRPEYQENLQDVLEGRYPRLSNLSPSQSDEASRQWLANGTHLHYTRKWFFDVMKVLSPYLASHGGNILFFQLDDDQAINRTNYNGPNFWRYMETVLEDLQDASVSAGGKPDDVFPFINPTDMRVSAAGSDPGLKHPIAAMGQWYMYPGTDHVTLKEADTLQFFVEELKTQPQFSPMLIEFQAGWYSSGEDVRAKWTEPANTLLASRTLFSHGLRGLNYFPLQDTIYPAGYEVPWANHYYSWDAALNVNSAENARAVFVIRNGNLLRTMGRLLAQTHQHADLGIVYSLGSLLPQDKLTKEDILRISEQTIALQEYCQTNHVSVEYLDPEYQPLEQLQRHRILTLPVFNFDPSRGIGLDPAAEKRLMEYVQDGGSIVFYHQIPTSGLFSTWFKDLQEAVVPNAGMGNIAFLTASGLTFSSPAGMEVREFNGYEGGDFKPVAELRSNNRSSVVALARTVGKGKVILLGWNLNLVSTSPNPNATGGPIRPRSTNNRTPTEDALVPREGMNLVIDEILRISSVKRWFDWKEDVPSDSTPKVLVQLQSSDSCAGFGFLSLVNFSPERWRTVNVSIPGNRSCLEPIDDLKLQLPPHDSLFIPLHLRLKEFIPADEHSEIVASNAELVSVTGEDGHFSLGFHAPRDSELYLKLSDPLQWKFRSEGKPLKASWNSERGWLQVSVPASFPSSLLRYIEAEKVNSNSGTEVSRGPSDGAPKGTPDRSRKKAQISGAPVQVELRSTYELPVAEGVNVSLDPPIGVLESSGPSHLVLSLDNLTSNAETYSVSIKVNGFDLNPSLKKVSVGPYRKEEYEFSLYLFLKSVLNPNDKFATGRFFLKSRRETIEKDFWMVTLDAGAAVAYAVDLDRDGFPEVVLENSELRLIVTPNAGARAFVLLDKRTHKNIFTNVGGLRDKFALNENPPSRTLPRQIRGYFGLHNRPYQYEILATGGSTAIARFAYDAPDVLPGGAQITKTITLNGSESHFEVEYEITPHRIDPKVPQAFVAVNSVPLEYSNEASGFKMEMIGPTGQLLDHVQRVTKPYSGEFAIFFKPMVGPSKVYSYRVRYHIPIE